MTTSKDGALTGGPNFMKAVGDPLIESIISNDIPILTEQEKFNETVLECVNRVDAVLRGQEDPGHPTTPASHMSHVRALRWTCSRREDTKTNIQDQEGDSKVEECHFDAGGHSVVHFRRRSNVAVLWLHIKRMRRPFLFCRRLYFAL